MDLIQPVQGNIYPSHNCGEIISWLHFDTVWMVKEREQGKDKPYKLKLGTSCNKLE